MMHCTAQHRHQDPIRLPSLPHHLAKCCGGKFNLFSSRSSSSPSSYFLHLHCSLESSPESHGLNSSSSFESHEESQDCEIWKVEGSYIVCLWGRSTYLGDDLLCCKVKGLLPRMASCRAVVLFSLIALAVPLCWAARPHESGQDAAPNVIDSDVPAIHENYTRRVLAGCGSGNPIDDCWRCDSNWRKYRQGLADCAVGFGRMAVGGKNGPIYVVTDDSDDDVVNPRPGTLRFGVIQNEPLWIVFSRNMNIKLKEELLMNSFKTLDGRGANVHIAGGACITAQFVSNIIIHGIHIHDCKKTGPATVRSSPDHFGQRGVADGDAISIFGSKDIWVDHNYLSNGADGLVDVIEGSTGVTISNNYFSNHDKVMLLGAHPDDTFDTKMQVTVAFNHFGENLVERIPRCRYGYFHVVNNYYSSWKMYAIGGSENPTINSEGNHFVAGNAKEVTKRINDDGSKIDGWENWNWRSSGDLFDNGAFFTDSGSSGSGNFYAKATSFLARPAVMVSSMTVDAGPLML